MVTPPLLALAEVPHGTGRKAWCPPDSTPEQATLVHSDGARLTLAWEVGHVPFLAVWVDHWRGSREPVVALEPSLGFGDDVDAAAARGQTTRLEPNSPIAWSLEVRLCPAPPSGRGVDRRASDDLPLLVVTGGYGRVAGVLLPSLAARFRLHLVDRAAGTASVLVDRASVGGTRRTLGSPRR